MNTAGDLSPAPIRSRRCLFADIRGLSTVEYALLLVLMLAGSIALWRHLGQSVRCRLDGVSAALNVLNAAPSRATAAARCDDASASGVGATTGAGASTPLQPANGQVAPPADVGTTQPAAIKPGALAQSIAQGHAFKKHVIEQGEFVGLGINTPEEYAAHVQVVIDKASGSNVRSLRKGRTAYWDDDSQTLVIHNPHGIDKSTAYRPTRGRAYFEELR